MTSTLAFVLVYDFIFKILRANIFLQSKNLFTSQDASFIKEILHKQRFFFHQKSFPQAKIFPSSRKVSTSRDLPVIKEVFHNQRFSASQDLFLIKEVFHKQIFCYDHKSCFPNKDFTSVTILKILGKNILTL